MSLGSMFNKAPLRDRIADRPRPEQNVDSVLSRLWTRF